MKLSRKQFERLRRNIEQQELVNESGTPILYGVEHAIFEQQKYKRLIAVVRKSRVPGMVKQCRRWMRQLECARQAETRFQQLRYNIRTGRPDFLEALADSAP